jgi:sortase A
MAKKITKKKKRKGTLPIIILAFLMILVGVGLIAYPIIASKYEESVRSEVHTKYEEMIQQADTSKLDAVRKKAEAYNKEFFAGNVDLMDPGASGYFEQLLVGDISHMGYVSIPKLNVLLPIYHGIGDAALARGCGHMPQSSLPIGGRNTHAVLSAHTGMASGAMFSDLELLKVGDIFQLEVLGETMTYQIMSQEDIKVVLPVEINDIKIQTGEDLVTLVTCTPFGVNSHRLLVTGHRIANPDKNEANTPMENPMANQDKSDSVWMNRYQNSVLRAVFIIVCALLLIIVLSIIITSVRRHRKKSLKKAIPATTENKEISP